jgi:uncharacterized membrane protein YfcA
VLATLSPRGFSILFGVLVLLAVLLSALGFSIRPTGRNVLVAGTLAGFMGTTSSIGGPPVALIFQDMPGPELRGTLSAYFLGSTMLALTALTAIGRFGESELGLALSLLPGLLLGLALSSMTAGMLDRRGIRPLILLLSGLAGSAVLLRGLAALAA